MWRTGLVALRHVGSSWNRARTRVPCIGRWILNHCATREVPPIFLKLKYSCYNVVFAQFFCKHKTAQKLNLFFFLKEAFTLARTGSQNHRWLQRRLGEQGAASFAWTVDTVLHQIELGSEGKEDEGSTK